MDYFISDLHFGHKNCLAFDNRPFLNIEEQDKYIIDHWNEQVGLDDEVYILGDISWYNTTKTLNIFNQLNGIKHLIKGNHDSKLLKNRDIQKLFIEICDYKEIHLSDGKDIILCHYPIVAFKNHYYGSYHFFGHVHNGYENNIINNVIYQNECLYDKQCNMLNIGIMMPYMYYKPQPLDYLIKIMNTQTTTNKLRAEASSLSNNEK